MARDAASRSVGAPIPRMVSGPSTAPPGIAPMDVDDVAAARELFWHNVMRELLTSLSIASMSGKTAGANADLFDGRLAVLTRAGERVPIADVFPLFACGINTDDAHRSLSVAVECTVFQIRTPDGQVFTLPLHEIRAFHALSPELMKQLEDLAKAESESEESRLERPFGFAAFAAPRLPPSPYYTAPDPAPAPEKLPEGASRKGARGVGNP